jgi:hypothetical protein
MEPIIEEIDKSLLAEEIKGQVCLQELSRGKMQLYVLEGYKAPALMKEIGRLREIAFRTAGGGTGMSCDVDRYDLDSESGFRQLICWDSENCEVMGGYRILFGKVTFYPSYPSEALGLLEAFFQSIVPIMIPGSFRIIHTLCLFLIMPAAFWYTTATNLTLRHLPVPCMTGGSICLQSSNHI